MPADEDLNNFNPLEARCPMCRTQTVARPDAERAEILRARYPHARYEASNEDEDEDGLHMVTVCVGNRHSLVQREGDDSHNQHDWTFFVRPSRTDIVEEVQFLLVRRLLKAICSVTHH